MGRLHTLHQGSQTSDDRSQVETSKTRPGGGPSKEAAGGLASVTISSQQMDFKVGGADENKVKIQVPGLPIARSTSRGAMSLTAEEDSGVQ